MSLVFRGAKYPRAAEHQNDPCFAELGGTDSLSGVDIVLDDKGSLMLSWSLPEIFNRLFVGVYIASILLYFEVVHGKGLANTGLLRFTGDTFKALMHKALISSDDYDIMLQSLPPGTPKSIDDRFALERRSYLDAINAAAAALFHERPQSNKKKKFKDPAAHRAYLEKKKAYERDRKNRMTDEDAAAAHRAYLDKKKAYDRDRKNALRADPAAHRAYLDRKKMLYARDPVAHRAYLDRKKSRYAAKKNVPVN